MKKEPISSCKTTKAQTDSFEPIEAERKFLVEIVGEMPECRELEISQTYLNEKDGLEPRVRKRKENGQHVYFLTTKQFVSVNERVEIEREISQAEYEALLADPQTPPMLRMGQSLLGIRHVHRASPAPSSPRNRTCQHGGYNQLPAVPQGVQGSDRRPGMVQREYRETRIMTN